MSAAEQSLTEGWRRLHPLSPVIRAGRALIGLGVIFGGSFVTTARGGRGGIIGHGIAAAVLVGLGVVAWLVTRWRVQDGVLRIETGLLRRQSLRFPLSQLQAIDTVRPGLARLLGLAELRLRMAGSTGSSGRLAYLTVAEAASLRDELLSIAGAAPGRESVDRQEVVLVRLSTARLLASIGLSRTALTAVVVIGGLLLAAVLAPKAAVAVLGSSGAAAIGLATALWRRFNSGFRLTVVDSQDGIRLQSGLVETTAETIPSGRVQAVRMVEPWLWRPLGWCRVEVDVAGHQRRHGENSAEGRELRELLPVGTRQEAESLLRRILPDAPPERASPPTRARWRNPFRYGHLAWGWTDTCAVTTSGWPGRVTSWVPLRKVQSLRLVQGPLQRRLALATIHLDTAGRSVHAALIDRDEREAERLLDDLTIQCRVARRRDYSGGGGSPANSDTAPTRSGSA